MGFKNAFELKNLKLGFFLDIFPLRLFYKKKLDVSFYYLDMNISLEKAKNKKNCGLLPKYETELKLLERCKKHLFFKGVSGVL